jgi:hypothetical protein
MPLTNHEIEFLSVFIYEATTDPFKRPATDKMQKHKLYCSDISYLVKAYNDAKIPGQVGFGGKPSLIIPELPWASKEIAQARDAELSKEYGGPHCLSRAAEIM